MFLNRWWEIICCLFDVHHVSMLNDEITHSFIICSPRIEKRSDAYSFESSNKRKCNRQIIVLYVLIFKLGLWWQLNEMSIRKSSMVTFCLGYMDRKSQLNKFQLIYLVRCRVWSVQMMIISNMKIFLYLMLIWIHFYVVYLYLIINNYQYFIRYVMMINNRINMLFDNNINITNNV